MKIAVIGSRGLNVKNLEKYLPRDVTEIVSGGARGIDTCAREYALANGLKLTEFLPEYQKCGRGAPLKRNLQIGGKNIEAHIMSMVNEVYRRAPELKRLKLYGDFPVSNRAQVITFVSPPEFGATTQLLAKYGIRCRVFDGKLIRVGFHYCNMIQDVEHMFRCLKNFEDTEGKLQ